MLDPQNPTAQQAVIIANDLQALLQEVEGAFARDVQYIDAQCWAARRELLAYILGYDEKASSSERFVGFLQSVIEKNGSGSMPTRDGA
jgi:hypothetical protein